MQKNSRKTFLVGSYKLPFLILLGSIVWSLTMVKSGIGYGYGIGFWGPNGHDGVWHISLATALSNGSFELPIFAGETVKNYHIGFDLLLAFLHRMTGISITTLYFQILPPIMAILIGALSYRFVYLWKRSKNAAFWSTFFVYFAGNFGYFLSLLRGSTLGGESAFWAQPAVLTLINPPFAMSLIFILLGLNIFVSSKKGLKLGALVLLSLVFGALIQIKAYAGVVVLGGLFVAGIYELWKLKSTNFIKVFVLSSLISAVLFLPNIGSGSLLVFRPFWFLETMMSFPDRVGWMRFGEAMVNYRLGGFWLRAIIFYGVSILIFWYGNLGTRVVHEFYWLSFVKNKKWPSVLEIFVLISTSVGVLLPMLFIQRGTAWNTIQFFYYSMFFTSILSGIVFSGILGNTKAKITKSLLVFGMLVFTLPTTIGVMKHYLPSRPPAKIPIEETRALEFLSKQEKGIVLVMPFDRDAANAAVESPPRPLYLYESTAYISAFSGQTVWMEDEVNLDITGYDWQGRKEKLNVALQSSQSEFSEFLIEENIKYVYWAGEPVEVLHGLDEIYSNTVKIYKIH